MALCNEPQNLELARRETEVVELARVVCRGGSPVIDAGQPGVTNDVVCQLDERCRPHPLCDLERLPNLGSRGGRISGLSSSETSVADLDLRAKLEDYAPLEISGKALLGIDPIGPRW